ncbi:DUF4181 domain-containing protein [Sporosarcina sp. Marseille-Q4063]|uniref:DUF4181 domain-containing protein n=1 Tax=Sporosarcina sp. Marseille-Q4063 TaxID=2810514 RepID=UPI001BAF8CCC|nr:DUF4181 domain-containing protein [Sporosarcina sp. Marseille-Q4063]QUW20286.1 DUF4181 domain-containing protein [Sporosarcina sp. Marseille-Q4063]
MKELIVVGVVFIVIGFISEYFLKRKYNIDRKGNPLSKPIKKLQIILLTICFILYLVISSALVFTNDDFNVLFVLIPFFILISFIRGFLQWKYNGNANVWILETYSAIILIIFFIVIGLILY